MKRGLNGDGISEVVGFVFILAIVMAALSVYLAYGVPVLGREGEIEEMDEVRGWFVDFKTGVDQLWLNSPFVPNSSYSGGFENVGPDPENSRNGTTLFNATMGQVTLRRVINPMAAKEPGFVERYLPVFQPIRSSGQVSVRKDGVDMEELEISATRIGTTEFFHKRYPAPVIAYRSNNNYWLQQEYYYQLGGVFLRQWDQEAGAGSGNITVVTSPPITVLNTSETPSEEEFVKVEIVAINVTVPSGGFGSNSPIRVGARLPTDPFPLDFIGDGLRPDVYSEVTLTFHASSPESAEVWEQIFRGAAQRNGGQNSHYLKEGTHYIITRTDSEARLVVTGDPEFDRDVLLEVYDVNCTMRLENVPTVVE